jgi:O-antigen ligase
MSDPRTRIAALLSAAVSALLIWWGWKQGAYFGSVFYPGAALVFALLAMLAALAPFEGRLRGAARIALLSLLALAVWTLLSALWSPRPAAALAYGWHGFLYAALFMLGLWVVGFLRDRASFALAPVAVGGAILGIATTIVLATGSDVTWYLQDDGTLRFPFGYRNAAAAFWAVCLWSALALLLERRLRWQLRALLAGAATVLVELVLLAQSRGSIPGVVLALVVFLVLSRERLRATAVLALVVLPALPAIPILLELYRHGDADAAAIPLLRDAAAAIAAGGALSALLAAFAFGAAERRIRMSRRTETRIARTLAIAAGLAVVVVGSLFLARHGGPVAFLEQRFEEFNRVGYPSLGGRGTRFGSNVGSNRSDFWRVAAREGLDQPLLGGGAGSFQVAYLEHRRSKEAPEDPHSVEALLLSELGFPGLLLFLSFLGSAALAGLRSWRCTPQAALLAAGALAAAAQWLVQASVDWLWNYPGVTAPAIFLLGAAAGPSLRRGAGGRARRVRAAGVVALLALALLAVPPYLSGRYERRAREEAATQPRAAAVDFNRAADLNPWVAQPLLGKATVQSRLGEGRAALATLRDAARREPSNYATWLLIARQLLRNDSPGVRQAARRARALNPREPSVKALWRRLEGGSAREAPGTR